MAGQVHEDKVPNVGQAAHQRGQPDRCGFPEPDKRAAYDRDQTDPAKVPPVLIEQRADGVWVIANEAFGIYSVCNSLHRSCRVTGYDNYAGENMDCAPKAPQERGCSKKRAFEWWHLYDLQSSAQFLCAFNS